MHSGFNTLLLKCTFPVDLQSSLSLLILSSSMSRFEVYKIISQVAPSYHSTNEGIFVSKVQNHLLSSIGAMGYQEHVG